MSPAHSSSTLQVGHGSSAFWPREPPIPFLPVHVHPTAVTVPATVNPTALYNAEPAPMGIGDFGVGQSGHPYTYNTTEFLGNFSWKTLTIDDSGNTEFTDQLNVVLQFTQGATTYAYWIQDVAFMDSSTGDLGFENNIWNFSSPSYCLSNSDLSGNGTVYPVSGCEGYYAVSPTTQPGGSLTMPSPGDFSLLVRSYTAAGGLPGVAFEYWDGVTSYEVTYDNVVWPWATAVTSDRGFYVDGNATAPSGNFYDAELTLGGPGGGAATIAQSTTDASSRLFYWNGHNLEAPRAVWNFGSDTAEAISNVQSIFSHDPDGIPVTTQLNGTARNATPARAFDQSRVGKLAITAPSISSGSVSVNGTPWVFLNGAATVTLVPGEYAVWVNSSSQHNDLGECEIVAGATTAIALPGSCSPVVDTPTGSPSGVDLGQSVVFQATLASPGTGGDTFSWGSLSADLGCAASTTDTISCNPSVVGTYPVNVSVRDSGGQSNSSGILEFTVSSDPVVATPGASPTSVETGELVSFTVSPSGGSGGFQYTWIGLPTPCIQTATSSPQCHPGSSGGYSVSVEVVDSNKYAVTSGTRSFTVSVGPMVTQPIATPNDQLDLGGHVNFSVTATEGDGLYTYAWVSLPAGCSSSDSSTLLDCTPTAVGVSHISVRVTDGVGGAATSSSLTFTVYGVLHVGSLTASPAEIDLGENVSFAVHGVSGGTGNYSYLWTGLPEGCNVGIPGTIDCEPGATGTYLLNATVHDSGGGHETVSTELRVLEDPTLTSIAPTRTSVDVGQAVTFAAEGVSGGSGTYTFTWTGLPPGCLGLNASDVSCTPLVAGTSRMNLTLMDTNNASVVVAETYVVYSIPIVLVPTVSATSLTTGQPFELTAYATGGSGGTTYSWVGLPTGCASLDASSLNCTPSVSGTFSVKVTVRDSNGGNSTSSPLVLKIGSPPGGPVPLDDYLIVGVVALVVAVLAAVVYSRRRGRGPSRGGQ
jgi:hypothetical protein